MKLSDFKNFDPTFEIVFPDVWDEDVLGIANIESPHPHHFIFCKNSKYFSRLGKFSALSSYAEVGLVLEETYFKQLQDQDQSQLEELKKNFAFIAQVKNVGLAMAWLSQPFFEKKLAHLNHYVDGRQMGTTEIHPSAQIAQGVFIGEHVKIGENVVIFSGATIMNHCEIDDESVIYPQVTLYSFTRIGKRNRLHAGAVIGADGFGYQFDQGVHHKIWHSGGVILGNDVEIGANSCVDSGTFSPTIIGKGTKLDNHVQIGHNCRIGLGVIICGHVAIGGSSVIGDYTVFGGKSGMGSDMVLGKACQVAGGALVNCDWPDGSIIGGHPARPLKEWMRGLAYVRKHSTSQ